MRGHVFKRGSTWSFIHDVGRRADGRRQQTLKGGFATKREAQAALFESLSLVAKGIVQDPGRLTLREYLVDQWLPSRCTTCGRTRGCRTRRRLHLLPHLGDRQLRRLTRSDCDYWCPAVSDCVVFLALGPWVTARRGSGWSVSPEGVAVGAIGLLTCSRGLRRQRRPAGGALRAGRRPESRRRRRAGHRRAG